MTSCICSPESPAAATDATDRHGPGYRVRAYASLPLRRSLAVASAAALVSRRRFPNESPTHFVRPPPSHLPTCHTCHLAALGCSSFALSFRPLNRLPLLLRSSLSTKSLSGVAAAVAEGGRDKCLVCLVVVCLKERDFVSFVSAGAGGNICRSGSDE